jgi:hypothetical protein
VQGWVPVKLHPWAMVWDLHVSCAMQYHSFDFFQLFEIVESIPNLQTQAEGP